MSKKSFLNGKAGKLVVYLIAITILLGILCFINPQYIPIALVIFVCFAVYTIVIIQQREEEIETQIKEITTSFDKVAKIAFMNAPIPLAIVNDKGMIIWNSNRFTDEFMETDINRAIKEIIKEHKVEVNNNRGIQECKIENQIELGERKYHVMGETVRGSHNLKNQNLAALYFLDETEHLKLEEQCKDSQICVGILTIDNYEEMMQAIEEEEKPQTIASVEKKIYDWASRYQGLMIKSDRDKFIAIFEQKALEQIQEQKFSILDEIKELNIASKIPATLSIAISNEGKSNYEKYKDDSRFRFIHFQDKGHNYFNDETYRDEFNAEFDKWLETLDYDYNVSENKERFSKDRADYIHKNLDREKRFNSLDLELFGDFVGFYDEKIHGVIKSEEAFEK